MIGFFKKHKDNEKNVESSDPQNLNKQSIINENQNSESPSQAKSSNIVAHAHPHPLPLKSWEITKHIASEVKEKIVEGAELVFEKSKDIVLGAPEDSQQNIQETKPHGIIKDEYNKRIIE
jgi:hypothetical protein